MIERIKGSFDAGVRKIRWYSTLIGERLRVEAAVIKLLGEVSELEKRSDELKKSVGHRVFELRDRHGTNFLKEPAIREALAEIERMEARIVELRAKASDIGKSE